MAFWLGPSMSMMGMRLRIKPGLECPANPDAGGGRFAGYD